MDGSARPLRMNQRILAKLEDALASAQLRQCAVAEEHQEAMRLYLESWVVGPLESALKDIRGVR